MLYSVSRLVGIVYPDLIFLTPFLKIVGGIKWNIVIRLNYRDNLRRF